MKLDDRFMTIMTALLLIIGIGAVMHRGEDGTSIFSGSGNYAPKPDAFTLRAGRVQALDVLLNDNGVSRIEPSELSIVQPPSCGDANAINGTIQYSSDTSCSGNIVLSYCVPNEGNCEAVPVTLTILKIEEGGKPVGVSGGENGVPLVFDEVQQGDAPQEQTQIAMKQPMKLSLPETAEVITPSEATEDIRRLASDAGPAVAVANVSDSNVVVSNTSARSGRVETAGISMAAPSFDETSSGISIASPSAPSVSPSRAPAPGGLAMNAPTAPSQSAPSVAFQPGAPGGTGFQSPSFGAEEQVAIAIPTPPTPNPVSKPAPASNPVVAAPVEEPSLPNNDPVSTPKVPGALMSETELARLDPVNPILTPEDIAPATTGTAPVAAPDASEEALPTIETVLAVDPSARVASPNVPLTITLPSDDDIASGPAAAQDARPAKTPDVQLQPVVASAAPTATSDQIDTISPARIEAPESSGVLASLARSNTVFGATVSAARALFSPSDAIIRPVSAPAGTELPRPKGVVVASLSLAPTQVISDAFSEELPGIETAPRLSPAPSGIRLASLAVASDTGYERIIRPDLALGSSFRPSLRRPAIVIAEEPAEDDQPRPAVIAALTSPTDTTPVRPSITTPQTSTCDVALTLDVRVGAEIIATLVSPCRPEQPFLVEHAGLKFTAFTDSDGLANFIVPALLSNAIVTTTFEDGGSAVGRASVANMSRLTRVAVIWDGDYDFDLHAFEFGAGDSDSGHVWAGATSNYRAARRAGGGYLTQLGPVSGEGARAEVYTLFQNTRTQEGTIDLGLRLLPGDAGCPEAAVVSAIRSEAAKLVNEQPLPLDLGSCSAAQAAVVDAGLSDIEIARN